MTSYVSSKRKKKRYVIILFYYCLHQSICPSMSRELRVLGHHLSLNYFIISCKASLPAMTSQSVLFGYLIFLSFSIMKDSFAGNRSFLSPCCLTFGISIFETMTSSLTAALLCATVPFLSILSRFSSLGFGLVIITYVDVDLCCPDWSLSSFLDVSTSISHQM